MNDRSVSSRVARLLAALALGTPLAPLALGGCGQASQSAESATRSDTVLPSRSPDGTWRAAGGDAGLGGADGAPLDGSCQRSPSGSCQPDIDITERFSCDAEACSAPLPEEAVGSPFNLSMVACGEQPSEHNALPAVLAGECDIPRSGWYVDDYLTGPRIVLCPDASRALDETQARLMVVLGCQEIPVPD